MFGSGKKRYIALGIKNGSQLGATNICTLCSLHSIIKNKYFSLFFSLIFTIPYELDTSTKKALVLGSPRTDYIPGITGKGNEGVR